MLADSSLSLSSITIASVPNGVWFPLPSPILVCLELSGLILALFLHQSPIMHYIKTFILCSFPIWLVPVLLFLAFGSECFFYVSFSTFVQRWVSSISTSASAPLGRILLFKFFIVYHHDPSKPMYFPKALPFKSNHSKYFTIIMSHLLSQITN